MSWLKGVWERLFHWSNITYIANAYSKDVWIATESNDWPLDRTSIELWALKLQGTGPFDSQLAKRLNTGWVKLSTEGIHKHNRSSKTERITIVSAGTLEKALAAVATLSNNTFTTATANEASAVEAQESSEVLVFNYEIQQNYSYVITDKGNFLQHRHGSKNLFQDFRGCYHSSGSEDPNTPRTVNPFLYLSVFLALLSASLCFFLFRDRIQRFFTNYSKLNT